MNYFLKMKIILPIKMLLRNLFWENVICKCGKKIKNNFVRYFKSDDSISRQYREGWINFLCHECGRGRKVKDVLLALNNRPKHCDKYLNESTFREREKMEEMKELELKEYLDFKQAEYEELKKKWDLETTP